MPSTIGSTPVDFWPSMIMGIGPAASGQLTSSSSNAGCSPRSFARTTPAFGSQSLVLNDGVGQRRATRPQPQQRPGRQPARNREFPLVEDADQQRQASRDREAGEDGRNHGQRATNMRRDHERED